MSLTPCPYQDQKMKDSWWSGYKSSPEDECPFESFLEVKAWNQGKRAHDMDIRPIPSGYYCYKFKEDPSKIKGGSFPIISCPYLVYEERELFGCKETMPICKFLERMYPLSDDMSDALIMDQVKNCGENKDD